MLKKFYSLCELAWKIFSGRHQHDMGESGSLLGAKINGKLNIYWCLHHGWWRKLAYINPAQHGARLKWQLLKGLMHEAISALKLTTFGATHDRFSLPYKIRNKVEQRHLASIEPFKLHKKYIITLTNIPESLSGAKMCIKSAERFGEREGIEIFPGIKKKQSEEFFKNYNLTWSYPFQSMKPKSILLAEMGCFASHYLLWEKCVDLDEPIMVLEDDVEFRAPVPALRFDDFIYLGKPPPYVKKNVIDTLPASHHEVYYPFKYSVGTFAYGIKPNGARKLLSSARKITVYPADNFITPTKVRMLFYRPQPITTSTMFSSIR